MIPSSLFASQWEGIIIGEIKIDQKGGLAPERLREAIGLNEGDRYQTRQIRRAIESLYKTGQINYVDVQVAPLPDQRLAVTFVLSEKRLIVAIASSGHRQFTQKEVWDALRFTPGEAFDEREWEERLGHLFSLYKGEGYFDVKIKTQLRALASDPLKIEVLLGIEEGKRARIQSLSFAGNRVFPDPLLHIPVLSRKPLHFSSKTLEDDMRRLLEFYKKGGYRMATVGPPQINFLSESHEVEITLPISASTKFDIFYEGLDFISGLAPLSPLSLPGVESLDRFVQISAERGAAQEVLEESAREIERFYHDKGYPFATVGVEEKRFFQKNLTEVHFKIENLTRARIRKIEFKGNRTFKENRLKTLIKLKKEGIFTRTRFTQEQLRDDVENLTLFYKKEGFQTAQVMPDIRFDEKKKWAILTFNMEEGTQTQIATIAIRGAEKLSEQGLFRILSVRPNDPYNKGVVREGAGQILTAYARLGYIEAKVDSGVTFSSDNTAAHIQYQITEGRQVFFGSLHLFGNVETRDEILLQEMAIRKGDPYDDEKILKSQQRLSQTGLFSEIRFDPIRNPDNPALSDMNLTVVERPRVAIEVGAGYVETGEIRGFLELSHRNIAGAGRKASARAEASQLERKYRLDYKEPRLFSHHLAATIGSTFFFTQRESFAEEGLVGTLGVEKRFSPLWKGALLYQYEEKEISNVKPGVTITKQDIGRIILGSLNPSFTRDTRNDPLQPKTGALHSITIRDAAKILGSEVQMIKITHQSSFFFSAAPKTTIALSARVGVAEQFGETKTLPLSERFFLGGRSTVRGYDQDKLGLEGETINNGVPTGGNAMLIFNEELRFPLFKGFGGVLFFDHGNVWPRSEEITPREIKSTAGIGLRYNTPIGPFRLDRGYKLDREAYESPYHVHFTIGHAF